MSVQTIWQSALYKFGQAPDNSRFADDFYSSLNAAQRAFCTVRQWGFLRTSGSVASVEDARTVALPSGFGTFYDNDNSAFITAPTANVGTRIVIMTHEEWLGSEYYDDGTETGTPAYGFLLGDNLNLSPIPDAAYTIELTYFRRPTMIYDTSSSLIIPDVYEEALQKLVWRRLQDSGYSSVQELQISDMDIARLLNDFARDDVRRYGGMTVNLRRSTYSRRTT